MDGRSAARILLLGPVAIATDGRVLPLGSRQQAHLLALLALTPGRPLSTDELVDRTWPGTRPASAAAAIRVQMARLRTALRTHDTDPDPLPHTSRGYTLDPRFVTTDLGVLRDHRRNLVVERDPAARLQLTGDALALWRGEPTFATFDDRELQIEAQRLAEIRLELQDAHTDALLDLGEHVRACSDLVPLVAAEPLRERRSRQLMLALYRSGRQADALATFRQLRDHLVEELGVDPASDTAALELAILRQDPTLLPRAPSQRLTPHDFEPPTPPDALPRPTPQLAALVAERLAPLDADTHDLVLTVALLDGHATRTPVEARLLEQAVASRLVNRTPHGTPTIRPELRDALLATADATHLAHLSHRAGTALAHPDATPAEQIHAAWLVVRGNGPWAEAAPVIHRALNTMRAADLTHTPAGDLCGAAAAIAPDAAARADLLIRRTRALALAGFSREADAAWAEAITAARASNDPERLALAVVALDWAARSFDAAPGAAAQRLRDALDGLGPRPSALRLTVLTTLIEELVALNDGLEEVPLLAAEAEEHGELLADPESLAVVLTTQHILLRGGPDLERRRRTAEALAATASETLEPRRWMLRVHDARLLDALAAGDLADIPRLAEELHATAEALRSRRLLWQHALVQTSLHRDRGQFAEADRWAEDAVILGTSAGVTQAQPALAAHATLTHFLTGTLAPLVPTLSAFLDLGRDTTVTRALLALACAHAGLDDAASTALDATLATPLGVPSAEWGPFVAGVLSDAAAHLGRADVAAELTARLAPFSDQWLTYMHALTWGPADRCLGRLALLAGESAEGVRLLRRARAQADAAGATPWVARIDADLTALAPTT